MSFPGAIDFMKCPGIIFRVIPALLAALGFLYFTASQPVMAQAVQGVVVLVNDQPISNFDIEQRLKLMRATTGRSPNARMREEVIEQLIDENLKMQEAGRVGVSISEQQVSEQLARMAKQSNMSMSQFRQALGQLGIRPETLSRRIEAELAWQEIVTARFQSTVRVSEQDVELALGQEENVEETTRTEYSLQEILFLLRPGSPGSVTRTRQNEAKLVRRDFNSCGTSRSLLVGMKDVVVKELNNVTLDSLPSNVQNAVKDLQVGSITQILNTQKGMVLYGVCARKDITDDKLARTQVQNRLLNQEFSNLALRYIRDLRQDAIIERR